MHAPWQWSHHLTPRLYSWTASHNKTDGPFQPPTSPFDCRIETACKVRSMARSNWNLMWVSCATTWCLCHIFLNILYAILFVHKNRITPHCPSDGIIVWIVVIYWQCWCSAWRTRDVIVIWYDKRWARVCGFNDFFSSLPSPQYSVPFIIPNNSADFHF